MKADLTIEVKSDQGQIIYTKKLYFESVQDAGKAFEVVVDEANTVSRIIENENLETLRRNNRSGRI